MAFWTVWIEAVLVSLSGVLAPGPISSVAVGYGGKDPRAGARVAVGHGLVEIPLMTAVFFGVGALVEIPWVRTGIALLGGMFLLYMGVGMLRGIRQEEISGITSFRSPLVAGAVLSISNPYFLVWWVTVGAGLILRTMEFGFLGFAAFAVGHWLCDLGWDSFLSYLSFQGGQFFGRRFQQVIFAVTGGFLLYYGGRLIFQGIQFFHG